MIPGLVRSIIYPLHERVLSRPTFRYLAELEQSQWATPEELEHLQEKKLADLLLVAQEHCPWHAERIQQAGIELNRGLVSQEQLRRLPTMDKGDARTHSKDMVWRGVPGGAHPSNTGGSSGTPLTFMFGRARQASDAAGRMRARRWWGVEVGAPEVYLWGAPSELAKTDRIRHVRDRIFNQLVLNAFAMAPDTMDAYLESIQSFRPHCLYGYASSIALLAAHARAKGKKLRIPSLRVVCVTGEPIYEEQRELIREVFHVPIANEFGSRDVGFTAHESPDGQMLLLSESIMLEALGSDGNPVAAGDLGEAVMTGLCSQAQPFIRYRTGDMIRMSGSRCEGGRGLHVIDEVVGRRTDFVVRSDGTIMHALAVIYVLRAIAGVAEFKVIQHEVLRVEVQVVPGGHWSDESRMQIVEGIRARLGTDARVDVLLVEEIAPESSGKHRYVISHVPLPQELAFYQGVA